MQVCCPCCNTEFPIEAGFAEADGKRLAAVLAEFDPAVGRAMISYLRLFKPAKTALRVARAAKLAREVADLVAAGNVCRDERGGIRRPAPPIVWAQAMEQMAQQRDRLTLPLDSHGYLRAVAFGIADQADAVAERAREATASVSARRRPSSAGSAPVSAAAAARSFASSMVGYGQWSQAEADAYVGASSAADSPH